jgi:hypothetical protein
LEIERHLLMAPGEAPAAIDAGAETDLSPGG